MSPTPVLLASHYASFTNVPPTSLLSFISHNLADYAQVTSPTTQTFSTLAPPPPQHPHSNAIPRHNKHAPYSHCPGAATIASTISCKPITPHFKLTNLPHCITLPLSSFSSNQASTLKPTSPHMNFHVPSLTLNHCSSQTLLPHTRSKSTSTPRRHIKTHAVGSFSRFTTTLP